ncbi:hypothetical protein F5Y15DRAFT_291156 [Xylariaceae sp. FL0016]|nr:hypothetical protein F5Y15DRAFT_291156 [Xylariaceae sp. FL0016]
MHLPRPVLPSQRYSTSSDYTFENHHDVVPTTRQPLGESTGNVQQHSLANPALCFHSQLSLSPPIHSIPTPPILPTQALTSSYGTSLRGGRSLQRNVSLQESPMGYPRGSKNPIYAYKNFADYRNKVMQKELEKEQPIWPLWLEDAFLDALLLIPQMGRKKFSSKTILYGRNMLITEYLWVYHWLLHPPQKGERIPDRKHREKGPHGPGHPMYRTRKQVSSHIQVLKGFFNTLVTFHFIFPSKKDSLDDDKKLLKEEEDTESFKNNRVLISIADGRLPDERPNYEYFARLLAADNDVFLRPKTCWIFVSSSKVSLKEKHVQTDEGATKKQVSGFTPDGHWLGESDYPHLKLNDGKEYKDLPRTGNRPTVLLHEYTRSLAQKESSSIKDLAATWDVRFPELKEKLLQALDDTRPSDERTSRCVVGPCDTFHFEVVLDLHATSKFPDGSELNGLVELAVSRPDLHNHSWRSITSVVKPEELHISDTEPDFWERSNPIEVNGSHRPGCSGISGLGRCDCAGRGCRDTISVPFPAHSWANTFIKLAPYVTSERDRKERERAAREAVVMKGGRAEREAARIKKENEDGHHNNKPKPPTPKELLKQVAMYQEIWSLPPGEACKNAGESSMTKRSGGWTRRAVILWTFAPVHENTDEKGKTVTVPPGVNWRFLTKFDPTSQYHQQHAYLSGSPNVVSRDNIMSPNPGYAHHINAVMHENLSAAYDGDPMPATAATSNLGSFTLPSHSLGPSQGHQGHHQQLADLFDGFSHGLSAPLTPPPTASYAHSFDGNGNTITSGDSLHHHLSFMSDATSGADTTDGILTSGAECADSFLSGLDVDYMHSYATHSTQGLADLAAAGVNWGENGGLGATAVTTADRQWATIAAAAGAIAENEQGGVMRGSVSAGSGWSGEESHQSHQHEAHAQRSGDGAHDAWTAWQATELASMGTHGNGYGHEANSLDEDDAHAFTLSTGLTPLRQHLSHAQSNPLMPAQLHSHAQPHSQSGSPTPTATTVLGRKRSRTESVDTDGDEDEAGYHAASMRRTKAPTAVMEEGLF